MLICLYVDACCDVVMSVCVCVSARRRSRNVFLSGVRTDNTTSRFYRSVGVEEVDNGYYALILGNRLVETPANNVAAHTQTTYTHTHTRTDNGADTDNRQHT